MSVKTRSIILISQQCDDWSPRDLQFKDSLVVGTLDTHIFMIMTLPSQQVLFMVYDAQLRVNPRLI